MRGKLPSMKAIFLCGSLMAGIFITTLFQLNVHLIKSYNNKESQESAIDVENLLQIGLKEADRNTSSLRNKEPQVLEQISVSSSPHDSSPLLSEPNVETKEKEVETSAIQNKSSQIEFSACLLVKDENDNLIEWIAYHYYMLNLRTLIICTDPLSVSDPIEITSRWEPIISTTIWNESIYVPDRMTGNSTLQEQNIGKIDYFHILKQKRCYAKCLQELQERGKTWTILVDPDEFITFNTVSSADASNVFQRRDDDTGKFKVNFTPTQRLGIVTNQTKIQWERRLDLPIDLSKRGDTIANFISKNVHSFPFNLNCVIVPRLLFGPIKETRQEVLEKFPVLSPFDSKNFTTLTYFSHAHKDSFKANGYGKSIIDVSKSVLRQRVLKTPHVATDNCMNLRNAWADTHDALLRIYHYTRSREAFQAKLDLRRTDALFESRKVNHSQSYNMQGWVERFVEEVGGKDKARTLLKGAGQIRVFKHATYDLMKDKEEYQTLLTEKSHPKRMLRVHHDIRSKEAFQARLDTVESRFVNSSITYNM